MYCITVFICNVEAYHLSTWGNEGTCVVSRMSVTFPVPFSVVQFYGYRTPRNYTGKLVDVLGEKKGRT